MVAHFYNNFMIWGPISGVSGQPGRPAGPAGPQNGLFQFFQKSCAAKFGAGYSDRQAEISVLDPNRENLDMWRKPRKTLGFLRFLGGAPAGSGKSDSVLFIFKPRVRKALEGWLKMGVRCRDGGPG